MSIFTKLNVLIRASAHDSVEAITDANCIRIYRQEVRDAVDMLSQRRRALGLMIAARKDIEAELEALQGTIRQRESQVQQLDEPVLTEDVLLAAAQELASLEEYCEVLKRRQAELAKNISREEIQLRRLVSELSEHRRELKMLESQLGMNKGVLQTTPKETIAERLLSMREARLTASGNATTQTHLEEGIDEAEQRLSRDSIDQVLLDNRKDTNSLRVAAVLQRLKLSMGIAAL